MLKTVSVHDDPLIKNISGLLRKNLGSFMQLSTAAKTGKEARSGTGYLAANGPPFIEVDFMEGICKLFYYHFFQN